MFGCTVCTSQAGKELRKKPGRREGMGGFFLSDPCFHNFGGIETLSTA